MNQQQKESYTEPVLVAHELLHDVTGQMYGVKTGDKVNDGPGF